MIECTACEDKELLLSILKEESIWNNISEDYQDKESFVLPSSLIYFKFVENGILLGVCAIRPVSSICAELHTCLLKTALGLAKDVFTSFAVFLLENTILESLITIIPEVNKRASAAAKKAGFEEKGFLPLSYRKGGELIGQYIYQVIL